MASDASPERPFDMIAETVGEQTADAFGLLGNETRMEILVALWGAIDSTPSRTAEAESGLTFSDLRDRVGIRDSGQFNYHLDKLTGKFVDKTDDTYTLTTPGRRILSAVIAGAVTDPPSFVDEPVDTDCWMCGGSVVIDYSEGLLRMRCTDCDGAVQSPDGPPGVLMATLRPPSGLMNRTPQEFFRQTNVAQFYDWRSFLDGVCPDCTGTVTATAHICENHESEDGSLCPHCHRHFKIAWNCVCDVCKSEYATTGWAPILTETAVLSFYYERGMDVHRPDPSVLHDVYDTIETTVSSRDPLELTVTVEVEGDRLTARLDEDARVIEIDETST